MSKSDVNAFMALEEEKSGLVQLLAKIDSRKEALDEKKAEIEAKCKEMGVKPSDIPGEIEKLGAELKKTTEEIRENLQVVVSIAQELNIEVPKGLSEHIKGE